MRRPWWAPSLRRRTHPSTARRTYQVSATGIWRRAVPESTATGPRFTATIVPDTRAPDTTETGAAAIATGPETAAGAGGIERGELSAGVLDDGDIRRVLVLHALH